MTRSHPHESRDKVGAPEMVEIAAVDLVATAERGEDHLRDRLQLLTKDLAFHEEHWDKQIRDEIREIFDERAENWGTRADAIYRRPLEDALERGGVEHLGCCIEIGSGTGIQTPTLVRHFDRVISIDISFAMLSRTIPTGASLLSGDAAQLPIVMNSIDAVVCVNAFLFPHEYAEVIAPHGAVVFVSTWAELTPIYLSPQDVWSSLNATQMGRFTTTSARAASGCWTVAKRL